MMETNEVKVDVEGFDKGFAIGKGVSEIIKDKAFEEGRKKGVEEERKIADEAAEEAAREAEKKLEEVTDAAEKAEEEAEEKGYAEGQEEWRDGMEDNLHGRGALFNVMWRAYLVNPIDTENDLISLGMKDTLSALKALRQTTYQQNMAQTAKARKAEERVEQERDGHYRVFPLHLCH